MPELLKVFQTDKDAHRRRAAVLALGFLGPPAKDALPDLEAEAKKLADKEGKSHDEEWLATALDEARGAFVTRRRSRWRSWNNRPLAA